MACPYPDFFTPSQPWATRKRVQITVPRFTDNLQPRRIEHNDFPLIWTAVPESRPWHLTPLLNLFLSSTYWHGTQRPPNHILSCVFS
jgi:hypothetical protein